MLENQSAAFVKDLLETNNLLASLNLDPATFDKNRIIAGIVDQIIKTDMTYHFGMLEQLMDVAEFNQTSSTASSNISIGIPINILPSGAQHYSPITHQSPNASPVAAKSAVEMLKQKVANPAPLLLQGSSESLYSLSPISKIMFKPGSGYKKEHMMQIILHAAGTKRFINVPRYK